jgi:conjugative transfer signal peptidase TraF
MIEKVLRRPQRRRRGRKRPRTVLALTLFGLGLIGLATLGRPAPWLVWNASASAPVGLYRVLPGKPSRGDLVLVRAPSSVRQLAAERGYLPQNVSLVKRVAALDGDIVCAANDVISVNGRVVAQRRTRDRLDRPLPSWSGCHLLDSGEAFLLMEGVAGSFDARYFGPTPTAAIIGRLAPLWVE